MLVLGYAQAILFRINASSGGIDIIAKILNKFFGWKKGQSMTVTGLVLRRFPYAFTEQMMIERNKAKELKLT